MWHGKGDQVVPPAHAAWWHAAVPGSELNLLEQEGHVSLVGRHGEHILRDALRHSASAAERLPAPAAAPAKAPVATPKGAAAP